MTSFPSIFFFGKFFRSQTELLRCRPTYHWVDLVWCSSSFVCLDLPWSPAPGLGWSPAGHAFSLPSAPTSSPDPGIGWWSLAWRAPKPPGVVRGIYIVSCLLEGIKQYNSLTLILWKEKKIFSGLESILKISLIYSLTLENPLHSLVIARRCRQHGNIMLSFSGDKGKRALLTGGIWFL